MTVSVDKLGIEPNRKKVISIEYGIRTVTGGHDSNGEGGEGGGVQGGGTCTSPKQGGAMGSTTGSTRGQREAKKKPTMGIA